MFRTKMFSLGCLVPILFTLPALAQEAAAKPAIDPAAIAILESMSAKLAAANTISVKARGQFDVPTEDGQPIFYMTMADVTLQRPDKLKVAVLGDGPKSEFVYDGKSVNIFMPEDKVIAVGDAPGTIEEMLDKAYNEAGISFPYADFLIKDPARSFTEGLNSAFVIGQSELVGGTTTDMIALANDDLQAQLWIGAEDKLPRMIWITPTQMPDKPRRAVEFSDWQLDGPVAENTFKTSDDGKAVKIGMASPDVAMPDAKPAAATTN